MHVVGMVGSMRKDGNTNALVAGVIDEMKALEPGLSAELIHVADKTVEPCRVTCSRYCAESRFRCSIPDDVNDVLDTMTEADALVIGTPLYFRAPPARFQALAERLVSVFFYKETQGAGGEESPLAGKPCGLVGVAEYLNPHQMLEYLHDFCTVLKMRPVRLDRFPYLGVAGQGDFAKDDVFSPFERTRDLAAELIEAVKRKERRGGREK